MQRYTFGERFNSRKFLSSLNSFIQIKGVSSVYLYATRTNTTDKFETLLGHIVYVSRSFDFNLNVCGCVCHKHPIIKRPRLAESKDYRYRNNRDASHICSRDFFLPSKRAFHKRQAYANIPYLNA